MGKICSLGFKLTKNQKKKILNQKQNLANLQNFVHIIASPCKITGTMKYLSCQHIFRFWNLLNSSKIIATAWETLNVNPKKGRGLQKIL